MLHKIDSLFSIESLGNVFDRVFSPDFDYKGERHDYMEFVYVVSGRVQVTENGEVYRHGDRGILDSGALREVYGVDAKVVEIEGRHMVLVDE